MAQKWYEQTYRRILFDMHTNDWDERFLSRFDPEQFIDNVIAADATTVTVPANNHVGLSFFPTKGRKSVMSTRE